MHLMLPANAASKRVPAPPRKPNMTTSHGDPKRIFIAGPPREPLKVISRTFVEIEPQAQALKRLGCVLKFLKILYRDSRF